MERSCTRSGGASKKAAGSAKTSASKSKKATAKKNGAAGGGGGQGVYDEKAIQTLDALEHIRLRSGMYIGRLGDGSHPLDGIYVMLKEVLDNAIDEFIMGEGKIIEIDREGDEINVRDFGRGIPLGKLIDCLVRFLTFLVRLGPRLSTYATICGD